MKNKPLILLCSLLLTLPSVAWEIEKEVNPMTDKIKYRLNSITGEFIDKDLYGETDIGLLSLACDSEGYNSIIVSTSASSGFVGNSLLLRWDKDTPTSYKIKPYTSSGVFSESNYADIIDKLKSRNQLLIETHSAFGYVRFDLAGASAKIDEYLSKCKEIGIDFIKNGESASH